MSCMFCKNEGNKLYDVTAYNNLDREYIIFRIDRKVCDECKLDHDTNPEKTIWKQTILKKKKELW